MRAIDADALMKKLGIGKDCSVCEQDNTPYCSWNPNVVDVCEAICDAPTIEPERKKGEWITDDLSGIISCSRCGYDAPMETTGGGQYKSKFCPNCGADMREDQDETD